MAHDSRGRSEIALLCRALLCVGLLAALPRTARAQAAIEAETRAEIHSVWPTLDEIVLAEAPSRWGTGPVEVVADPSDANSWFLLARAIDTERVPAALQRWIGRRVEIGLADGRVCSSTVTSLRLVAVGAPDAREERAYTRIAVDEPSPEGPLHERFARTLWPRSQAFVVASTEPGCARGRWAWPLDAAVAAHALPEPVAPDTPLHQAAWAAFRALPAHARIQLAWARSPARLTRSAQWDAVEGPPIVRRFTVGARAIVIVAAGTSREVHGLDAHLAALFDVSGPAAAPVLTMRGPTGGRPDARGSSLAYVEAVLAFRGTGALALLGRYDGPRRFGPFVLRESSTGALEAPRSVLGPY